MLRQRNPVCSRQSEPRFIVAGVEVESGEWCIGLSQHWCVVVDGVSVRCSETGASSAPGSLSPGSPTLVLTSTAVGGASSCSGLCLTFAKTKLEGASAHSITRAIEIALRASFCCCFLSRRMDAA